MKKGMKTKALIALLAVFVFSLGYLCLQGTREGFKEGEESLTKLTKEQVQSIKDAIKELEESKSNITDKEKESIINTAIEDLKNLNIYKPIAPEVKPLIIQHIQESINYLNTITMPNLTDSLTILSAE